MQKLVTGHVHGGGFNFPALPLRYLNAVKVKQEQYRQALQAGRLDAAGTYCVVINGGMVHMHGPLDPPDPLPPIIVRTLCGPTTMKGSNPVSGADLLRRDPAMSVVIFQANHIKNRPEAYGRENGRDLVVILNPKAQIAFPWQKVLSGRIYDGDGNLVEDRRDPALQPQMSFP